MVSSTTARRMLDSIDKLEARLVPREPRRVGIVCWPYYLDKQAVVARHYELFPEDVGGPVIIFKSFTTVYGAGPYQDDERANKAWRQIDQEARAA